MLTMSMEQPETKEQQNLRFGQPMPATQSEEPTWASDEELSFQVRNIGLQRTSITLDTNQEPHGRLFLTQLPAPIQMPERTQNQVF
jgi:hypothetical protein